MIENVGVVLIVLGCISFVIYFSHKLERWVERNFLDKKEGE